MSKKAEETSTPLPVGARPQPQRKREGFAKTKGEPDAYKELVRDYAKQHDISQDDALAYLVYVGYNRRMALQRQERKAGANPKPKKKRAKKASEAAA